MSRIPISRSPDLKRLRDEGFEVEVVGSHLVIRSIPYVNSKGQICFGALVSVLTVNDDVTVSPVADHIVYFSGDHPCHKDGSPIKQIEHSVQTQTLAEGIVVNRSFSNKPPGGYTNYFDKMTRYIEIISAPAKAMDVNVSAQTYTLVETEDEDDVFNYSDSASSRSGISAIAAKLKMPKVAIIGLGGTGSYVLDLVAKTPVQEIHLFDGDKFLQHNAFRSPSAASREILKEKLSKVAYFQNLYGQMRRGIIAHELYVTEENFSLLDGFDFVFICVDKGYVRKLIINGLIERDIPFIDVGMGVYVQSQSLNLYGMCRMTLGSAAKRDHIARRVPMANDILVDDAYVRNIQIADLNALNATLAVIKWKKSCGFYQDFENEHNVTFSINNNQFSNDERP